MDFSSFCLALRSLSSSFFVLIVLWCPLRSCCTVGAFSKYQPGFKKCHPSETYLSCPSSTVWSVWWSEKGLFHPDSHPSPFRFPIPIRSGFYSSGALDDPLPDSLKYLKLWMHHFSLCTQLRKIFNCNCLMSELTVSGGVCTFLSSIKSTGWIPVWLTGSIREKPAVSLPSESPAELLFEAIPLWRILWDPSILLVWLKRYLLCWLKE